MIKFLVGLGADLNQVGPDDRSPIIFAITTADHNHNDENKMDHDHLEGGFHLFAQQRLLIMQLKKI